MLRTLHILGLLFLIISLLSLGLSRFLAIADIVSHFQAQIMVAIAAGSLAAFILRRPAFGILGTVYVLVITLFLVLPSPDRLSANQPTDLYFQNFLFVNNDAEAFEEVLISQLPPTVAVVESNQTSTSVVSSYYGPAVAEHTEPGTGFGCTIHTILDSSGAGVLAPENSSQNLPNELLAIETPYPICFAQLSEYTLIAVHPAPPLSGQRYRDQSTYFKAVDQLRTHLKGRRPSMPVVIVGDFNSTRYSGLFRQYFKDIFQGHHYTWRLGNRAWQPFHLPIDHALSDTQLFTKVAPDMGSDHRGLFVGIEKPPEDEE